MRSLLLLSLLFSLVASQGLNEYSLICDPAIFDFILAFAEPIRCDFFHGRFCRPPTPAFSIETGRFLGIASSAFYTSPRQSVCTTISAVAPELSLWTAPEFTLTNTSCYGLTCATAYFYQSTDCTGTKLNPIAPDNIMSAVLATQDDTSRSTCFQHSPGWSFYCQETDPAYNATVWQQFWNCSAPAV